MSSYGEYLRAEWKMFLGDPQRERDSLTAVESLHVGRVLDVCCGAGQEMLPFVGKTKAFAVGIDISPEVGRVGHDVFSSPQFESRVAFVRSAAECLPFPHMSFDVIICRLALHETDGAAALDEMARVLRPGGILLLKIHSLWFYAKLCWAGLRLGRKPSSYATRALTDGLWYNLTGGQPQRNGAAAEVFYTRWRLRRELARRGLRIVRELKDSSARRAPSFVIVRDFEGTGTLL